MKRTLDDIIRRNIKQKDVSVSRESKRHRKPIDVSDTTRSSSATLINKNTWPFVRNGKNVALMSYDPNCNTPDRFQPVIRHRVYSSGSKRLVDLTAVNIMKAHGIEHIVFVSTKKFPLPSYWADTGISFHQFEVEGRTELPTPYRVKEIIAHIEKLFEENPDNAVLICNYSNSDNEYAVHTIASLLVEKFQRDRMRAKGIRYVGNYEDVVQRMFSMSSYDPLDYKRREMITKRLGDCFDEIFTTQSKMDRFITSRG